MFIIGNADLKPFQATNTSFSLTVRQAVDNNCLSTLELAQMASSFKTLHHFIQVSNAYCNSFLPDGIIEGRIYLLGDAKSELEQIRATGTTPYATKFPWPYGYAKHLTERLLFHRYPELPILIVRPSCIGQLCPRHFRCMDQEVRHLSNSFSDF
jgi:fatty acyl-CoA reductase